MYGIHETARQSLNIPVHQASKSNCKTFSDFMHGDLKLTTYISHKQFSAAVILIVVMSLKSKNSGLVFIFANLDNIEGYYTKQTFH